MLEDNKPIIGGQWATWSEEADERLLLRAKVDELREQNTKLRLALREFTNERLSVAAKLDAVLTEWERSVAQRTRAVLREPQP